MSRNNTWPISRRAPGCSAGMEDPYSFPIFGASEATIFLKRESRRSDAAAVLADPLINRLRLRPRENFLETWIGPKRVPLPAPTQLRERKSARFRKELFDERDCLLGLTGARVNQSQTARIDRRVGCIFALRHQLHGATTQADGFVFPAEIGVKNAERR